MTANQAEENTAGFPSTRWTHVRRAAAPDSETGFAALDTLLRRYRPALRTHLIRGRCLAPDRADDVLQGFIAEKILDGELLRHANERKGKFRTFLLTSLDHYLVGVLRKEQALKRSPGPGRLHDIDAMKDLIPGAAPSSSAYDIAWAQEVIADALHRMEAECSARNRMALWEVFRIRVVEPILEGRKAPTYDVLVTKLGFRSPAEASNTLVTAKRMFARTFRDVIGEYVASESEIDAEIAELEAILSGITPE